MSMKDRRGWLARLLGRGRDEERGLACRELVELVTAYLDSALPGEERARVEAHLKACPDCERYLAQFRLAIAATGRLREEDLAPEAKSALLDAFRGWKAS